MHLSRYSPAFVFLLLTCLCNGEKIPSSIVGLKGSLIGELDSSDSLAMILLAARPRLKFETTQVTRGVASSSSPNANGRNRRTTLPDGTSRRAALSTVIAASLVPRPGYAKGRSEEELVQELKDICTKMDSVQGLLDAQKWDGVRTVLKNPPVSNLWVDMSKNTLRQLADAREDLDLFEAADEISLSLQELDQYVYDNNFISFQPGNGKLKIKEPKEQLDNVQEALGKVLAK